MRIRLVFALGVALLLTATIASSAVSRFAGTYTTMRPGAGSTQALKLVLEPNGRAAMTTSFPELERTMATAPLPLRESGTWKDRGTTVHVRFTSGALLYHGAVVRSRRHENVIDFALRRCRLTAVRYSKMLYGEAGLTFERSTC